ncbi:MAG: hypothetical protein AB1716_14600, partial [Planctomycetota bacterium]
TASRPVGGTNTEVATMGVEYAIRLRPIGVDPAGRDPEYRLRCALKTLLRGFGLRAVAVERIGGRQTSAPIMPASRPQSARA